MSAKTKNVITEKIPEFRAIPEDWKIQSLNKVTWYQEGPGLRHWQFTTTGMKVINVTNLEGGVVNLDKTDRHISIEEFEKSYKHFAIDAGDILMASSGATYCKTAVIAEKDLPVMMNTSVIRFKPIKDVDYSFLIAYLSSFLLKRQIDFLITGGAQPNFGPAHLNQTVIPLPPLPEQKAIAQVLSTADAAIQTTEKLIAQKELRKKWLMQQLLTGKKRLKGYGGEWKENHLGSLGETYTGLIGKNKEDFGEGKPYIPYLNIFNNARIDITNFDFVKIAESDNQNRVKYGDIFFTVSSETPDEVGMASVMLDHIDDLYLNSFCFGFRLHDFNTLVPEFSSYFLRADAFRAEIYKLSQGATRFNLSKNNLMKLNIVLPPKEEQTAIAQVLQAADKEISLLKAKAEKLREQKKGLMQVLLTGKVRLNINKPKFAQ